MKIHGLISMVAIIALLTGIWVKDRLSRPDAEQPAALPDFSLSDLAGKAHNGSEWAGRIRVVNFWATWCPPCRKEIPELAALHNEYAGQGVVVIGIAIDDPEAVTDYLTETPIDYPLLMAGDQGMELTHLLGNRLDAVPFTVIADRHGQIVYRHRGRVYKYDLQQIIAPLLKQ